MVIRYLEFGSTFGALDPHPRKIPRLVLTASGSVEDVQLGRATSDCPGATLAWRKGVRLQPSPRSIVKCRTRSGRVSRSRSRLGQGAASRVTTSIRLGGWAPSARLRGNDV